MHIPPHSAPVLKPFDFDPSWVRHADDTILIVNKPSGLLSVPGRGPEKQECLLSHLQVDYPDARIVHRLDMDTSGLMVVARNRDAHRHLSRQFQERETQKSYLAVCTGQPSETHGKLCSPMRCDWERRPLQMIDFLHGKYAETHWQLLEQHSDRFLVRLMPVTGRSHQLRLHMKLLGHPILGDNLYADRNGLKRAPRLMLHAHTLRFRHPKTNQTVEFTCEPEFDKLQTG